MARRNLPDISHVLHQKISSNHGGWVVESVHREPYPEVNSQPSQGSSGCSSCTRGPNRCFMWNISARNDTQQFTETKGFMHWAWNFAHLWRDSDVWRVRVRTPICCIFLWHRSGHHLLGKAVGCGLPVATVLCRGNLREIASIGQAEFTNGGQPLACAAGMGMLKAFAELQLEGVIEQNLQAFTGSVSRISPKFENLDFRQIRFFLGVSRQMQAFNNMSVSWV